MLFCFRIFQLKQPIEG